MKKIVIIIISGFIVFGIGLGFILAINKINNANNSTVYISDDSDSATK